MTSDIAIGKPKLDDVRHRYESASKHNLPVLGTFMDQIKHPVTSKQSSIPYIVTKIPELSGLWEFLSTML